MEKVQCLKRVGKIKTLDDKKMEAILKKFESYGQRNQKLI